MPHPHTHHCLNLLLVLPLMGLLACEDAHRTGESLTAPATPTLGEKVLAPPASRATDSDLPDDVKEACSAYGIMAATMAADRDRGVSFAEQLDTISNLGDVAVTEELSALAEMIYNAPFAMGLTPEGASQSFFISCLTNAKRERAGARTYTVNKDIETALKDFKTFSGKPLVKVLAQYGIKLKSVEVAPVEGFSIPIGQTGDVLVIMELATEPNKTMPCRLTHWVAGDILPVPEALRRGSVFPVVDPEMDPLLYWAATGRCSDAYDY